MTVSVREALGKVEDTSVKLQGKSGANKRSRCGEDMEDVKSQGAEQEGKHHHHKKWRGSKLH
jgi:hypothetical protein